MSDKGTPAQKRPNTDMAFSPLAQPLDKETLKQTLSDILDVKLVQLNEKIDSLVNKLENVPSVDTIETMKSNLTKCQSENAQLKEQVRQLEYHQRRNNVKFYGIKEEKGEDLDSLIVTKVNKHLSFTDKLFDDRTFERVHRLGPKQSSDRIVIAKFNHFKDKLAMIKIRAELKNTDGISFSDDYPADVEKDRKVLYPIFKALRNYDKNIEESDSNIYMKQNIIVVNGNQFSAKNIEKLPVKPAKLFTPEKNEITAFFTDKSPLSNHYLCEFVVNGECFNCAEQYIMSAKADLFNDPYSKVLISRATNPVQQKVLGSKIKHFDPVRWETNIEKILYDGLLAKFQQNPELANFLLTTGNTTLVEANPKDCLFGVGLGLYDTKIWDKNNWADAKNYQGKMLERVRATLQQLIE